MKIRFDRKRVRGGVVRIYVDERFAGEIATCKNRYALRLPGIYWHGLKPSHSGMTQTSFDRQKDAIYFVSSLEPCWLHHAATTCEECGLDIA